MCVYSTITQNEMIIITFCIFFTVCTYVYVFLMQRTERTSENDKKSVFYREKQNGVIVFKFQQEGGGNLPPLSCIPSLTPIVLITWLHIAIDIALVGWKNVVLKVKYNVEQFNVILYFCLLCARSNNSSLFAERPDLFSLECLTTDVSSKYQTRVSWINRIL